MRILVLAFYYPPDLSACAFRMKAFVPELAARLPAGSSIDVLTTLPNRYHSFRVEVPEEEQDEGVRIRRIRVPPHRSGLSDQARSFSVYARAVLRAIRSESYDLVFATSSRLMTAALGRVVSGRVRAPLYLDLRDIFVESLRDVLPARLAWGVVPPLSLVERVTVGGAGRVNLVSEGFAEYFRPRYPGRSFSFIPNGIDPEFLAASWDAAPRPEGVPRRVVYAGNMGEGQGLHAILPSLALALGDTAHFRLVGDGGKRVALEEALRAAGVDNVELLPPMERGDLIAEYREADVLFLHLNDHEAFRRVLPSKVFEYAATGRPIWAGVAGYAAEFLRARVPDAVVFPPCNVEAAAESWNALPVEAQPREAFVRAFSRRSTSAALAKDVLELVGQVPGEATPHG